MKTDADFCVQIILIRRGTCNFVHKIQNAQAAGAIAAVVDNDQESQPLTMGAGDAETYVTISSGTSPCTCACVRLCARARVCDEKVCGESSRRCYKTLQNIVVCLCVM